MSFLRTNYRITGDRAHMEVPLADQSASEYMAIFGKKGGLWFVSGATIFIGQGAHTSDYFTLTVASVSAADY